MNKLTIVFDDKTVGIDGLFFNNMDLSSAPSGVHALQWNVDKGWVEFSTSDDGEKLPNESISSIPEWANPIIEEWNVKKANYDLELAQKEQKMIELEKLSNQIAQ